MRIVHQGCASKYIQYMPWGGYLNNFVLHRFSKVGSLEKILWLETGALGTNFCWNCVWGLKFQKYKWRLWAEKGLEIVGLWSEKKNCLKMVLFVTQAHTTFYLQYILAYYFICLNGILISHKFKLKAEVRSFLKFKVPFLKEPSWFVGFTCALHTGQVHYQKFTHISWIVHFQKYQIFNMFGNILQPVSTKHILYQCRCMYDLNLNIHICCSIQNI